MKAILYDLDGLLVNTEYMCYQVFKTYLKDYDIDLPLELYTSQFSGHSLISTVHYFIDEYHITDDEKTCCEKLKELEDYFIETQGVELKKGAKELLEYASHHHIKNVLATSSQKERALHLLGSDIIPYFDDMVFGPEVKHAKPAPDIFLKCIEKIGVKPTDALVLEDSDAGIEAAYQAGIPVICIPDLKQPGNKHYTEIKESLIDIIDYIERKDDE